MNKSSNLGGLIGLAIFCAGLAYIGFIPFAVIVFIGGAIFISNG